MKPWQIQMTSQITNELQEQLDFIGVDWLKSEDENREVKLLDYACGTGTVTRVSVLRAIPFNYSLIQDAPGAWLLRLAN